MTNKPRTASGDVTSSDGEADPIEMVRRALATLKFGEIVIAVHDGKIVQIARTEKFRPPVSHLTRFT